MSERFAVLSASEVDSIMLQSLQPYFTKELQWVGGTVWGYADQPEAWIQLGSQRGVDGTVLVAGQYLPAAPPAPHAEWEDVVEFSARAGTDFPGIVTDGLIDQDSPGAPRRLTSGPGDYRLRVHVSGRDNPGGTGQRVLVHSWKQAPSAPETMRLTSEFGKLTDFDHQWD